MIAQLKAEAGPARDAALIAQQKAAHGQALPLQKAYVQEGTTPPLKGAAADVVPVVEHHIEMLKTLGGRQSFPLEALSDLAHDQSARPITDKTVSDLKVDGGLRSGARSDRSAPP